MRLSVLQRLGFFVLGVAAAAVGGWAYSRSEMTVPGLFAFLPGLILVVGALFGTVPNFTVKDTKVEWTKGEEPKAVEPGEDQATTKAIEQLGIGMAQANHRLEKMEKVQDEQGETSEATMAALQYVSNRLEDYILAHAPAPDDGLTDEARLDEWVQGYRDLDREVDSLRYQGADHYAGPSSEDLRSARAELDREWRRQQAQFTFGMREKAPRSVDD